jgi:uncharacterized membrane protein YtjA (UPF0391 family)
MLKYALVFLMIAIAAGLVGFGGMSTGAVAIAKGLFFAFLLMFVVTVAIGMRRRR